MTTQPPTMSNITTPPPVAPYRISRVSFSERSDSGSRDRFHRSQSRRRSFSAMSTVRDESVTRARTRTRLISRIKRGGSGTSAGAGSTSPAGSNGWVAEKNKGKKGDPPRRWMMVRRDVRTLLPRPVQRFTGYRNPSLSAPYPPIPFPPFTWLSLIPIRYEVYLLSTFGGIIGILLIQLVMSTTIFLDAGTPLIIASFGAGAVLCYGTIDSPLAQPRHVFGGQVISAVVGVGVTKLFRLGQGWELEDTTKQGELARLAWVSAAIGFGMAFLVMQVTGTTHPPGGATALIASVQPSVVLLGWKYVHVIAISTLIMLGWALVINNIGRRCYPHYWFHGTKSFVLDPHANDDDNDYHDPPRTLVESEDRLEMDVEEGRRRGSGDFGMFGLDDLRGEDEEDEDEVRREDERGRRMTVGQRYS